LGKLHPMLRILFTFAMLGHVLEAEARRPPGPPPAVSADPFVLIVGCCFAMAFFAVKFAFRISDTMGYRVLAICASFGIAAIAFPVMWTVYAVGVPLFLLSYLVRHWRA
jgi:hypothetical protein